MASPGERSSPWNSSSPGRPDLTCKEVKSLTRLDGPAIINLYLAVIGRYVREIPDDDDPIPAAEAALIWLADQLMDALPLFEERIHVVVDAWPAIFARTPWLESDDAGHKLYVEIMDRQYAVVDGLPARDLHDEHRRRTANVPPPIETIRYDVIELYHRNRQLLLAGRKEA